MDEEAARDGASLGVVAHSSSSRTVARLEDDMMILVDGFNGVGLDKRWLATVSEEVRGESERSKDTR
jgi:hypothetical protein